MGKGPYISGHEYPEFGNYYISPFVVGGITFNSVEQYFQYNKCVNPEDQEKILNCTEPEYCAKLGRKVQLRNDWEQIKYNIMYTGMLSKILHNYRLLLMLILTFPSEIHFHERFNRYRYKERDYWDHANTNILSSLRLQFIVVPIFAITSIVMIKSVWF